MNLAKNSCMASSTGKTALSHSVETDLDNSSHIITLLTSTRSGKGPRKTFEGKKVCLCAVCLSFFAVFCVFVCHSLLCSVFLFVVLCCVLCFCLSFFAVFCVFVCRSLLYSVFLFVVLCCVLCFCLSFFAVFCVFVCFPLHFWTTFTLLLFSFVCCVCLLLLLLCLWVGYFGFCFLSFFPPAFV